MHHRDIQVAQALKQNMSLQDFVALVLKKAVENGSEN